MYYLAQLTDNDYQNMANEIAEISETKSNDELFQIIGNSLHNSGLDVSTSNDFSTIQPKVFDHEKNALSLNKAIDLVENHISLNTLEAKEVGKRFWNSFKDKLKTIICNNPKIQELMNGGGDLTSYIKTAIPLILAALGITFISPLLLAAIAAIIAIIVKIGFNAYCEVL